MQDFSNTPNIDILDLDRSLQELWTIRPDTTYLNHGSFGPTPIAVQKVARAWQQAMIDQPMDFFLRQLEPAWFQSRQSLADFVAANPDDIIFCENATAGMNWLASFFPLKKGDEILLNQHEYGVVKQIWEKKCSAVGANCVYANIPESLSEDLLIDSIFSDVSDNTRLIIVSHITSPTAITFPVQRICNKARQLDIPVCVDGPHTLLQIPLNLTELGCDFYLASCHKWLSAPLGSGFAWIAPKWQSIAAPLATSWGRLPPTPLNHWTDHYLWAGTRDYSPYLSVQAAIDWARSLGINDMRERNHTLARYARFKLCDALQTEALVPDDQAWYGWMTAVWLPPGDWSGLQKKLWLNHHIEVPIVHFANKYLIRVSCHLYNTQTQIDYLVNALKQELC